MKRRLVPSRLLFSLLGFFWISAGCGSYTSFAASTLPPHATSGAASTSSITAIFSETNYPSFTPTASFSPSPSLSGTPLPTRTQCTPRAFSPPPTTTAVPDDNLPPLTVQMLKNGTYTMPHGEIVTLVNGWYEYVHYNEEGYVDDFYWVQMGKIAFGDLDHDGVKDAAVELAGRGGSAWTVSIHGIVNRNGNPKQSGYRYTRYGGFPEFLCILIEAKSS